MSEYAKYDTPLVEIDMCEAGWGAWRCDQPRHDEDPEAHYYVNNRS